MIPDNSLSGENEGGELLYPDNVDTTAFYDLELGGIALNDPTQGLGLKAWIAWIDKDTQTIKLKPCDDSQPVTTQVVGSSLSFVSLAFDTNMQPAIVYIDHGVTYFRWFDPTIPAFTVTTLPDVRDARVCTDDKRQVLTPSTDVILAYFRGDTLYYRQQRDRYTIERVLKLNVPAGPRLTNMGMNDVNRVQFNLRLVHHGIQ